ncbi:hypothetical protein J0910_00630 [Nocardiopsis sp. CNT-189]|uniref:hypothetical protein n=1 Tax=Nocardiopsis oceanisediminis TaxID=2816862 RepID=UPI003B2D4EC2
MSPGPPRAAAPVLLLGGAGEGERALAAGLEAPLVVEAPGPGGPPYAARWVAAASLRIAAAAPENPLLVAVGEAGPLAAAIGAAQRAAHRPPAGYVLVDALMPAPGGTTRDELRAAQNPQGAQGTEDGDAEPLAGPQAPPGYRTEPLPQVSDWPDAPCGYLLTDPRHAPTARLAGMRGWPVADATAPGTDPAAALADLIARL